MVGHAGDETGKTRWWLTSFASFFFRRKKQLPAATVAPSDVDVLQTVEGADALPCPTKDRVRGPPGRKRPSRPSTVSFPVRASAAAGDERRQEEARTDVRRESLGGQSSPAFNQTTETDMSQSPHHEQS